MRKNKAPVEQAQPSPIVTTEELIADATCCSRSFYYFLTKHCFTLNATNNSVELVPNWEFIKDLADKLQFETKGILIIKSRQMLCSIIMGYFALWCILYKDNFSVKCTSKKGEATSNGTWGSTFGKIQFAYDHLAPHLKQTLTITSRPMVILNPRNNSFISGETSNVNASRGDTNSLFLGDEFAYVENDELIFRSLVMASERVILYSTPDGESGTFWRLCTEQKDNGFLKMKIHWSQHPNRDAAWYKKKTAAMTEMDKAKELECSFQGSHQGNIFTINSNKHLINIPLLTTLDLKDYRLVGGMDYGLGDQTSIVTALQNIETKKLTIVATLMDHEMLPEAFNTMYHEQLRTLGIESMLEGGVIYGDPSGWNRNANNGRSVANEYEDLHLPIRQAPRTTILDRIREVQRWVSSDDLQVTMESKLALDTLTSCHYPVKDGVIQARDRWADPSKHFNVHLMDSIAYLLHSLALPVGDGIGDAIIQQVYQEVRGAGRRTPARNKL